MTDLKITGAKAKLAAKVLGVIITEDAGFAWNDTYMYHKGIPFEEWKYGLDVETEHGSGDLCTDVTHGDLLTTARIALAHFKEGPDYYKRLKKMEKDMEDNWIKWMGTGKSKKEMPKIVKKDKCTLADRWGQYIYYKTGMNPDNSQIYSSQAFLPWWGLGGKRKSRRKSRKRSRKSRSRRKRKTRKRKSRRR